MRFPVLVLMFAVPFGLIAPMRGIPTTHAVNPSWPGHARVDEVWQPAPDSALAVLCSWLAWRREQLRLAAGIVPILIGGFLTVVVLRPVHGGTMQHSDDSEFAFGGLNLAAVMMTATVIAVVNLLLRRERRA